MKPLIHCMAAGLLAIFACQSCQAQNPEIRSAIETIKNVDVKGNGHAAAAQAVQILNKASAEDVPEILRGMQGANKLALNWLRGAAQSALQGNDLPKQQLTSLLQDRSASDMGRLMAFELLAEDSAEFAEQNIRKHINDPSLPLRYLAVADFIKKAKETEASEDAIGMLGLSLPHARDVKQIQSIVGLLSEQGIEVNLQRQLGFIPTWHIVGPFDNSQEKGFDTAFGPEKTLDAIDLAASYDDSKNGEPVQWQQHNTVEATGVIDLNEILAAEKGVLAYAYSEFNVEEEREVEIRIGCINGNKVWVNGKEVINNEIYHVGMLPDQFSGKATLKEGVNQILFKVCQNEQTQPWANRWMFQLRVCESDGKAVLPYNAPAAR